MRARLPREKGELRCRRERKGCKTLIFCCPHSAPIKASGYKGPLSPHRWFSERFLSLFVKQLRAGCCAHAKIHAENILDTKNAEFTSHHRLPPAGESNGFFYSVLTALHVYVCFRALILIYNYYFLMFVSKVIKEWVNKNRFSPPGNSPPP